MEGFKGTPGPWGLDQFGNVVHGPVDGWGRKEKVRVSGVALPGRVTPEYEANTHLVVAAPELLEALQLFAGEEIMAQLNGSEFVEPTDDEEWVRFRFVAKDFRKAAAAIKKALGQ